MQEMQGGTRSHQTSLVNCEGTSVATKLYLTRKSTKCIVTYGLGGKKI